jgi:hypothetical protein
MKEQKKVNVAWDIVTNIGDRCPLTPFQYCLVKELEKTYVEVIKDMLDPDNPANTGKSTADPEYKFKQVTEKQEAIFQKGVIVKLDKMALLNMEKKNENFIDLGHRVGDVVLFPYRASMAIDVLPGYILVRPYDIIGVWDQSKEVKETGKSKK